MGTITNKLQRILDTKEDIRQVLIEEGRDVPADMPFRLYPEVLRSNKLEGLVGMYMGKGYTNESMSKNPVWYDTSGNGNHIALKNFGWKLDSGCGKYNQDFNYIFSNNGKYGIISNKSYKSATYTALVDLNSKNSPTYWGGSAYVNKRFSVKLSSNLPDFKLKIVWSNKEYVELKYQELHLGFNIIEAFADEEFANFIKTSPGTRIISPMSPGDWFTLEQIPDYSGAICFDGVDDFGETVKDLNFTNDYTVATLFVPLNKSKNNVIFGKDYLKDVYCNYASSISFWSSGLAASVSLTSDFNFTVCRRNDFTQEIKDMITGTNKSITPKPIIENNGKYYLGRSQTARNYSEMAVFAHAIFDHYCTDEELQVLYDYWKKEFPELFPDQAWTVTGKSNSDADRAVIKNITGNGNDLTLTNFAFAENSGYGKWPFSINYTAAIFKNQPYGTAHFIADVSTFAMTVSSGLSSVRFKFRVREMQEGAGLTIRCRNALSATNLKDLVITENGIYEFEYENPEETFSLIFYNGFISSNVYWDFYVDILQDPDHEGYLVTDGVDDSGRALNINLGENFTLIGEWRLFSNTPIINAGVSLHPQLHIFNNFSDGVSVSFRNVSTRLYVKTLKAICSDGRCYDDDWNDLNINVGDVISSNINALFLGYNGANFTKMAFKNLAIYKDKVFTKEQCIQAYNHLQTLKAK